MQHPPFKTGLVISILMHFAVFGIVFLFWESLNRWWGGGLNLPIRDGLVWVDLQSESGQEATHPIDQTLPAQKDATLHQKQQYKEVKNGNNQEKISVQKNAGGQGGSETAAGGEGDGLDSSKHQGGKNVLHKIKQRLMAKQSYPPEARKQGLEGRVYVSFALNSDGTLKESHITKSSGIDLLDNEALATLKKAQPYPYYAGTISLALTFALDKPLW